MTPAFTRADYDRLPEGFPAQLIEGCLVKDASPLPGHQGVGGVISKTLERLVGPRRVFMAPLDVPIDEINVFQPDVAVRKATLHKVFEKGIALGGAISGEHGIGTEKQSLFLELSDPAVIALMRRIKAAFDPNGILNPGTLLGEPD